MPTLSQRIAALIYLDRHRSDTDHRYRKHGGGPIPTSGTTTYAADEFNRADGGIGTADTGGPWQGAAANFSVLSNQARASSGAGVRTIYLDDGQSDGAWRLTIATVGSIGIMIRSDDTVSFVGTRQTGGVLKLIRMTAGVANTIGSGPTINAGDVVTVVALGNSIKVYVNDVLQISATELQLQSATWSGIWSQDTTSRVDSYSHKSA